MVMASGLDVETLSEDEAISLGFSPIVHGGEMPDPDNPIAQTFINAQDGLPQTDREGRPIISYAQYLQMGKMDARMDNYALRVTRPGHQGKVWLIQASKYHKWYGGGYEAIGIPVSERHEFRARLAAMLGVDRSSEEDDPRERRRMEKERQGAEAIAVKKLLTAYEGGRSAPPVRLPADTEPADRIYYCKDKYPDCKRFFDTARGLDFHWRSQHGEDRKFKTKKAKPDDEE